MSTFPLSPIFAQVETCTDFDTRSLLLDTPWETQTHHEPGILLEKSSEMPVDTATKRAFHNARERNRRKIMKTLYSQLHSLIPNQSSKRPKGLSLSCCINSFFRRQRGLCNSFETLEVLQRKLSIPSTVSRVLKYIPELRNEIKKLSRERAELLADAARSISKSSLKISKPASNTGVEELLRFIDPAPPPAAFGSPDPVVTVNAASGHSQMIITIYNCRAGFRFSTLLVLFEKEGLDVLNASTFISSDKVFHSLHLKVPRMIGRSEVDTNLLQKKLLMLLSNKTLSTIGVC